MISDNQHLTMHQILYSILHGEGAVYHPHVANVSWTPDEVEGTIINGLKAGDATMSNPEWGWLSGASNSMPEIYRDEIEQDHIMREQLINTKHGSRDDALQIKTKVRYQPHQHHIDQFEDVILWMFLIPQDKRQFFQAVIKKKKEGQLKIFGDDMKEKFYGSKHKNAAAKLRYDYKIILKGLCRALNHVNYPKRNEYEVTG